MMPQKFQPPTDEEIARYAYCLWESEGRVQGRDLDYWLQAKTHLAASRKDEAKLLADIPPTRFVKNSETTSAPKTMKSSRNRGIQPMKQSGFA